MHSGLNVNFLKHFHVKNKWKSDGKLKSWDDQQKYKDALMWGAKIKGERLPTSFYEMYDNYLLAFKKEFVQEKKKTEGIKCKFLF